MMTLRHTVSALVLLTALEITGCAGGSGPEAPGPVTPPPPTSPPPPPIPLSGPIPNTSAPMTPGALTPMPAPVEATSTTTNFSNVPADTAFPMLLIVLSGDFGGDAAGTAAGGTITVGGSSTLVMTPNFALPFEEIPPIQRLGIDGTDLDYTRFGYWVYNDDQGDGAIEDGVWNIGFVTPASAIPTSGQASYTGKTTGLYDEYNPCGCQADDVAFSGDMELNANFGTRTITGSFTNLAITGSYGGGFGGAAALPPTLNDVSFTASIDQTSNWFAGQTQVTSQPAGPQAFDNSATGSITGMFYGPAANEVGGVWTLSDSVRRLVGAFGGKQ